ncbi:MAG: helix-turn-helix domain-containing protein [Ruminococcaceae bacterium]|nr:helix-turn-helix domain-containing protein [Oscillospiraceae bacterium]
METGKKRGYLNEDFRIFHLRDREAPQVDYHYHEFDKLVLLLSGGVTYNIEGRAWLMKPGDLLFVPHGAIHKPLIVPEEEYERYVIWCTPSFLDRWERPEGRLSVCFDRAEAPEGRLCPLDLGTRAELLRQLSSIQEAQRSGQYLSALAAESQFVSFMIAVCRIFLSAGDTSRDAAVDPKITGVMEYIERNLDGDLSVEKLSSVFYISRYHLMRRFKAQSGYTLHQYVTRRRILTAAGLIGRGTPVAKAAEQCGYEDYSAFLRAFKSIFKVSPRSFSSLSSKKDIYNE